MKTYYLDPRKFPKQKKNLILLYGSTGIFLVIAAIIMNRSGQLVGTQLFVLPLMLLFIAYSTYRAIKQRKQFWDGYKLELGDNILIQNQPRYPELRINPEDMTSIVEKKFGLVISTSKYNNLLGITKDLSDADYQEIKEILYGWLAQNVNVES